VECTHGFLLADNLLLGIDDLAEECNLLVLGLDEVLVELGNHLHGSLHGQGELRVEVLDGFLLLLELLAEHGGLVSELIGLFLFHLVHALVLLQVLQSVLNQIIGLSFFLLLGRVHLLNLVLELHFLRFDLVHLLLEALLQIFSVIFSLLKFVLETLDILLHLNSTHMILLEFLLILDFLLLVGLSLLDLLFEVILDLFQVLLKSLL